jgi:hypothetical protein
MCIEFIEHFWDCFINLIVFISLKLFYDDVTAFINCTGFENCIFSWVYP